jgi:hypothetical protein
MLSLGLAACGDGTGPAGSGDVQVLLNQSVVANSVLAAEVATSGGAAISLVDVESIEVTVTRVQALLRGEDEDGGGWVDLALAPAAESQIDLLSLPVSGLEIANGTLAVGTYGNVRIFFEDPANISLANDVSVGPSEFLVAENAHDLVIPSAAQTGIKISTAGFEVDEAAGETLTIEFDAALSVQTVTATGNGVLMMSPVLTESSSQ